jgi:23S rRNA pseudouridine1911/1915/1917 synthase
MVNPVSRSENYTVAIPLEMAGLRLDQALARLLPDHSRSRLAKLIEQGHVQLDGEACDSARRVTLP